MRRMMTIACMAAVCATVLQADRVTATAVACPDMEAFRKLRQYTGGDKELYLMQQGCLVLSPDDRIHVIDPENRAHGLYLKVQVERTNDILYVKKDYVRVEQAGSGNVLKF